MAHDRKLPKEAKEKKTERVNKEMGFMNDPDERKRAAEIHKTVGKEAERPTAASSVQAMEEEEQRQKRLTETAIAAAIEQDVNEFDKRKKETPTEVKKTTAPTLLSSLTTGFFKKETEDSREILARHQREFLAVNLTSSHPELFLNPRAPRARTHKIHKELPALPENLLDLVVDYDDEEKTSSFKTKRFPLVTSIMQATLLHPDDLKLISVRSRKLEEKILKEQPPSTPVDLLVTSIINQSSPSPSGASSSSSSSTRKRIRVVAGPIGSGKSTFLRYLATAITDNKSERAERTKPISLYVSAKDLIGKDPTLENILVAASNIARGGLEHIEKLIKTGSPVVLCVDGLDEIPEKDRTQFLTDIRESIETIPSISEMIVGIRDYQLVDEITTPPYLRSAPVYYLNVFDKSQQQTFLNFLAPFIPVDPAVVPVLMELVDNVDTHWPATPLILTALLTITEISDQPNQRRITRISDVTDLLIDKFIEYNAGILKKDDTRTLLSIIAGLNFICKNGKEVRDVLQKVLESARTPDSYFTRLFKRLDYPLDISADELLENLGKQSLLFTREANGDLSFIASSMQSCLAADFMWGGPFKSGDLDKHKHFAEAFDAIDKVKKIHFSFRNISYLCDPNFVKLFLYAIPDWYSYVNLFDYTRGIFESKYKEEERKVFLEIFLSDLTPDDYLFVTSADDVLKEKRRKINHFGIPTAVAQYNHVLKGLPPTTEKNLGQRYRPVMPTSLTEESKLESDPESIRALLASDLGKKYRRPKPKETEGDFPRKYLSHSLLNILSGYTLQLRSTHLEPQTIQLEINPGGYAYRVIGLENKEVTGLIPWSKLPSDAPRENTNILAHQDKLLPAILKFTTEQKHTHFLRGSYRRPDPQVYEHNPEFTAKLNENNEQLRYFKDQVYEAIFSIPLIEDTENAKIKLQELNPLAILITKMIDTSQALSILDTPEKQQEVLQSQLEIIEIATKVLAAQKEGLKEGRIYVPVWDPAKGLVKESSPAPKT